jgi:hypothetical protein
MRWLLLALILGVLAVLAVTILPPSSAQPAKKAESAVSKQPDDWKEDPVCRMVFFAVLEGLYTDGVSSEAADRVVGRRAKGGPTDLKQTFVIECPLCHPVYEAFSLYQQRPSFNGDKRNTFGPGLGPDLERGLQNENILTRQSALQVVVQKWVAHRLIAMRLSPEEQKDWTRQLNERSKQGLDRLSELRGKDAFYKTWPGYAGCPACTGSTGACQRLQEPAKK